MTDDKRIAPQINVDLGPVDTRTPEERAVDRLRSMVGESVTQRSLDDLLLDPHFVGLPRRTLDQLLDAEQERDRLRLSLLTLRAALATLVEAPSDQAREKARSLLAELAEEWGPMPGDGDG